MAVQREQIVQTAEKYVSRGKIEPAIREYRKLLAENPNDINTLNRIGDLYARIQRIDEAVDFFTQIAEQYSTEGFFVKAIAIYKKIIKLDPTRLEVYEKLAELYHRQGLVNEARTQYQVLADYYQKHDNAASAIAIYQKMADLEPNNPSYHVKLAEIYQSQQLIEKAMNEYRVIAEMMMAHGRSQDAGQVYERALDIDSSNMAFINDAFIRLRDSGNVAAATRFLAFATERNPQAARLGRSSAVMAEPEAAAAAPTPAPMPVPAAPRQAAPQPAAPARPAERRAPLQPPPAPEPEPEPEVEIPYGSSFADQDDWDQDELAAALRAAAAATAPPVPEAPAAEPEEEAEIELELDLDEGFVLDMDADDEPASLVKPPPDMLAGPSSRLGSAWSRGDETGAAAPVPPGRPAGVPHDQGTGEFELDLGELGDLPTGPFKEVQLPADEAILLELELEQPELPPVDPGIWAVEQDLPPLELEGDLPAASFAGVAEMPGMPPEPGLDTDLLERTAAELHPPSVAARDEDLVSEAEVLAKYGLEDKALERLREALRIRPQNLGAYATMIEIHLDKGAHERVVELANIMSGIASRTAAQTGGGALWAKTRRRLVEAGYRLDGDRVQAGPGTFLEPEPAPAPPPPPPPVAPTPPMPPMAAAPAPAVEPPAELPAVEPVQAAPPPPPAPPVPPPAAPPRKRPAGDIDQMLRGLIEPRPKRPAAAPAPLSAAQPMVSPPAIPPPPAAAPPPPPPPIAAAEPEPAVPPRPVMFNPLEIGAMIESEEMDWEPSGAGAGFAPPPPRSPQASQTSQTSQTPPRSVPSLDDTGGLSWLDEAEKNRPGKLAEAGSADSRSVFDEEDDFFDLAAELEQELSQEELFRGGEGALAAPAEQSLEEIVEGFKKGVAEHLSPTDYDTHFNLGIAYREMGLLDEAIGEFQIAAKDDGHLVLCCSMLGLCFLDKGLPDVAITWYERGLEAPGLGEEDHLGLLYDLGCSYLALEDRVSAFQTFVDLSGLNPHYRDVADRIEQLGN